METLLRWIDRITGGAGAIAGWLIVPIIFATAYEVFSRYVLHAPTIWAFEVGYMAMGANFLFGVAYTLREKAHIRIDIFYGHVFSRKVQAVVTLLGYLVLLLPAAWLLSDALWTYAYQAVLTMEKSGQSAWNPIIWPFRMTFFAGFALLLLQGIAETIRAVRFLLGRDPHWSAD
jgi:TRAP-type mannitol/chloroaromatic compound transport system permease small subunit